MRASAITSVRGKYPSARAQISLLLAVAGFCFACLPCLAKGSAQARPASSAHPSINYDQMVQRAKALLLTHPREALLLCNQAIQRDPSRYEAHLIAASVLNREKSYSQALVHLQVALALAPDEERSDLSRAIAELKVASLPSDWRRKLEGLMLILDDAQSAQSATDREKFEREFLYKTDDFLRTYPSVSVLWLLRAQLAIDLHEPALGWRAGRKLIELGEDHSQDPTTQKLMARLERNGWLTQNSKDLVVGLVDAFNQKIAQIGIQAVDGERANGQWGPLTIHETAEWKSLSGTCESGLEAAMQFVQSSKDRVARGETTISSAILFNLKVADEGWGIGPILGDPDINHLGYCLDIGPLSVELGRSHVEFIDANGTEKSQDSDKSYNGFKFWDFCSSNRANLAALQVLLRQMHQVCTEK